MMYVYIRTYKAAKRYLEAMAKKESGGYVRII